MSGPLVLHPVAFTRRRLAPPGGEPFVMPQLDRAALTGDALQLLGALPPLANVFRYGNVRQTDAALVAHVLDGLIARTAITHSVRLPSTGFCNERHRTGNPAACNSGALPGQLLGKTALAGVADQPGLAAGAGAAAQVGAARPYRAFLAPAAPFPCYAACKQLTA